MFKLDQGKVAVKYARNVIEEFVKNSKVPISNLKGVFEERHGAFVTINSYPNHNLRGCIGIPLPVMPLKDAISEGACSATNDPRFLPLEENELDSIVVEVTILGVPELIIVDEPKDYLSKIELGRDGLIVEQGFYKGLLLPQVPIEHKLNKEEFLSHTCMKAGLMADAWFDERTKISKFTGHIFYETKPRGEIKEKKLDGFHS